MVKFTIRDIIDNMILSNFLPAHFIEIDLCYIGVGGMVIRHESVLLLIDSLVGTVLAARKLCIARPNRSHLNNCTGVNTLRRVQRMNAFL